MCNEIKIIGNYKVMNDTSYSLDVCDNLIIALERIRLSKTRIVLDYGDIKTNISWGEKDDISGRIGRSNGKIKIPILLHNSRSIGGGAIMCNRIIKIIDSKTKFVLYENKIKI